jgi:hypothetical protein
MADVAVCNRSSRASLVFEMAKGINISTDDAYNE